MKCPGAQPQLPKAKEREDKASITQWNQEQLQLLVKGVNLYPPGTADRLGINNLAYSFLAELHPYQVEHHCQLYQHAHTI